MRSAKTTIYCVLFAILNTMYGGYFYAFVLLWGAIWGVNLRIVIQNNEFNGIHFILNKFISVCD